MHCADAPCCETAESGVARRADGVVLIDPARAKGRRELVKACPYGRIGWNEQEGTPQKCTFCAHLMDEGWDKPRCVQACPNGALSALFVEENEVKAIIARESLEVLNPEYNTRPSVYYKNLSLFTHCFLAGSVAVETERGPECAQGAKVSLHHGGNAVAEQTADAFGDYKFEGLKPQGQGYLLEFQLPGYEQKTVEINLQTSMSIGLTTLKA